MTESQIKTASRAELVAYLIANKEIPNDGMLQQDLHPDETLRSWAMTVHRDERAMAAKKTA